MAYKHRIEAPGSYHITVRGNNKRIIFIDDHDRRSFCRFLNRVATKYGWTIFAMCLMDNHYHLVMRIGEAGMSRGMCELNSTHALTFNARHGRTDHLFGKRYWSDELRDESYFLNACRYVVQNPVRAGSVHAPEVYVWSSYRATIGLALSLVRQSTDELLAMFGTERSRAIERYVEFCATPGFPSHVRGQPP